LGEDIQKF